MRITTLFISGISNVNKNMDIDSALATIESRYGFVFKSKQVESIKSIVSGNDTFIVLPTGYGKSKIYNEHN